ncbi:uncharacterized protein B0H18DRAFT_1105719 [Fomitopsis serialis]|uniref:uncharacterized protein n=1 Tax=Fomitopsis serialis TaxID=139415 RepID=UPI002007F197|nr:uncharacterized protein B0H18DRAFT_1105719 [Neoantrodia serialis]KAH9922263.1 hypothetical protein B0H18DRAFT_1105719 [Neoantrodia serialis]
MHVHNVGVHGNLLQNNTLRSWDFTLQTIEHMAKDTGPSTVWTEVTDELHGIFSTIRSHQLEHIKVRVRLFFDDNFLAHKESSLILEKLDLRDLHEVMSGPYFDTLKDVEVEFFRDVHHDVNVDIRQKLKRIFRGILQPWSARGVVTVTWPFSNPQESLWRQRCIVTARMERGSMRDRNPSVTSSRLARPTLLRSVHRIASTKHGYGATALPSTSRIQVHSAWEQVSPVGRLRSVTVRWVRSRFVTGSAT